MNASALNVLIALAAFAAPAPAEPPAALERPGDPWMPPGRGSPPRAPVGSAAPSVQVNVNALGENLAGDAANEPSIAVDPTAPNRIAIGWRQFDTIASNFRQAGYSWSRDGGRTWAAGNVIEPGFFRSDPVLKAGADGTFYYLSLRVQGGQYWCDTFTSFDGGATWPSRAYAFGGDKAWFTVDTTGGPGHGNLYQSWNIAGNQHFPRQFNRFAASGPGWEEPVEFDPDGMPHARPVFGQLDVGPDGSVYVAGSESSASADTFWVVRSSNAQLAGRTPTFDQIVTVDLGGELILGDGPNPAGLLGQVNLAVDRSGGPTSGHVYVLCSVDPPGPDPMDVMFIRSEDGGLTWTAPRRVNSAATGWQWFGTMSVAPDGRIDAVWNDTGVDPSGDLSQVMYSFSGDGGRTWAEGAAISPPYDHSVGYPNQAKLGDYYDMVSDRVGASLAYAATFNGEQDVWFRRIGDRDCNGNGTGDTDDLAGGASGDCNANAIPDECEIAAGELADRNGDGVPDLCEGCPWDLDRDGEVGIRDLLELIAAWETDPGGPPDLDGDGDVDADDLEILNANWGPCG